MNDSAARTIAARQHGCVHRDQLNSEPDPDWFHDAPLVWSIPGMIDSHTQDVAWMLSSDSNLFAGSNPKAVASHVTACRFYGVGVLTGPAEFWTTTGVAQFAGQRVRVHAAEEVPPYVLIAGVPVTSPAVTVRDLVDAHLSADHVGRVVADMIGRGVATKDELVDELGAGLVDQLLAEFTASARH